MKNFILLLLVILIIIFCLGIIELMAYAAPKERVYFMEEKILLKNLPKNINNLRIWIPYPVSNDWQVVSDFIIRNRSGSVRKLASLFDVSFITDKVYNNRIIYLKLRQNELNERALEITLSFKVKRKENSASFNPETSYESFTNFLKPNRLVPVNGRIRDIAEKITQGKSNDLERVKAIYDYIINELTYSKDDPKVCGIGDSLLTLRVKKGICTDYHSLFISLVRSLRIPAKFEIGYRIPEDKSKGLLNGYHCWAKFYLKDKGWIPVDISEADKYPKKRDYFFGHIDENRVHLTSGRDITLEFAKDSKVLNFFIYPYGELNDVEFKDMYVEVSYRDLKGGVEKNYKL